MKSSYELNIYQIGSCDVNDAIWYTIIAPLVSPSAKWQTIIARYDVMLHTEHGQKHNGVYLRSWQNFTATKKSKK